MSTMIERNQVTDDTFKDALDAPKRLEERDSVEVVCSDTNLYTNRTRNGKKVNMMRFSILENVFNILVGKDEFNHFNEIGKRGMVDIVNRPGTTYSTFINLRPA